MSPESNTMKKHRSITGWLILPALAAACLHPPAVFSQGTAFTYQGNLAAGGGPASGIYDFEFTLYDAISNGNRIAGPLTNAGATVTSGLFTATLDFGAVFNGSNCWLQIAVRTNGADAFTPLSPLQALARHPMRSTPPMPRARPRWRQAAVCPALIRAR